ncbi:hypothetical protein EXT47_02775 [Pseudoalteromonas sp. CO342X]|uniref:hypothetical protein n=1 Tax=Pseudoalteromonas sp. CO342X TaxID=1777270 RepID=UPI00102329D9|nr:hypothetical protein [Pseudoalteromonas sp. CO342X]RZG17396.1 hypothetical protein EXT47_02775 [Pseudoalteromonas sp. CO342X]
MIKAKWLYSELPIPIGLLAKKMKENQYSENLGNGYLLSASTSTKLVGKYIERIIQKTVIEDPFGGTAEVESISYYTCHFNWHSDSNYLVILDPPRSLRKFINKLHEITGLGLVISELNISLEKWLTLIEESATDVKLLQISSYGIRTSQNSTAKVSVTGTKDVKEAFSSLVRDKRYLVDSIKFEACFDSLIVSGEITKTGVCRLKTSNSTFTLDILRESLEKSYCDHG